MGPSLSIRVLAAALVMLTLPGSSSHAHEHSSPSKPLRTRLKSIPTPAGAIPPNKKRNLPQQQKQQQQQQQQKPQRIHLEPRPPKNTSHTARDAIARTATQGISLRGANPTEHFSYQVTEPDFKCFQSNEELRAAVVQYESYKVFDEHLATTYGWPIGNWCVKGVTDFSFIFQHKSDFNDPLSGWDISQATTLRGMFQDAQSFDQPLGHFNTTNVVDMSNMFEAAVRFLGDGLDQWSTQSVTSMDFMFMHALNFQQDLSSWDVKNVLSMKGMFKDARSFSQAQHLAILDEWPFHPLVDMTQMDAWWMDSSSSTYGREEDIQLPPPPTSPAVNAANLQSLS